MPPTAQQSLNPVDLGTAARQQAQAARDQAQAVREMARAQVEAAKAEIEAAKAQGGVLVQPPQAPMPPGILVQVPPHSQFGIPDLPENLTNVSVAFFAMCAVMCIGFPIARAFGRRIERKVPPVSLAPDVAAQLQRIEQAVDTMAVEIERISESQRFLTKLQAGAPGQVERAALSR